MKTDIELLNAGEPDCAFLRFYQWKPYCLSLGYNQQLSIVRTEALREYNIALVQRPTGGKAVLHAEELTYAVIHPVSHDLPPSLLYEQINSALRLGLAYYDERLSEAHLEQQQPDFRAAYAYAGAEACFSTSARNELKFNHKKIVGSAQRKYGNKLLQHGSILCGAFHRTISQLLELDVDEERNMESELAELTDDLSNVLQAPIDYRRLKDCIKLGFEDHFKMTLLPFNKQILPTICVN
jgi:lipoate-protein ligase A